MGISWFAIDWTGEGAEEYPGGVILRDASGSIVRVALGPGDVDCRPFYKASSEDWIVKAIVASEDGAFFEHSGVRLLSIARAFWQNVTSRRRISGASTITMQTVRLIQPHKKSYFEKWLEAFRALKMERVKDKFWIITQYLNRAPFGANFIGIEAAANGWFGKSAKTLTLCEAALLAGMVQAPSRFRPDRRYSRALKRRDYVLDRMVKMGFATQEQAEAARSVSPEVVRAARPFKYPHYCDYFMQSIQGKGASGDYTTSLDVHIQNIAQQIVDVASRDGGFDASMVVRKVDSGEVIAMAVSGDYFSPDSGQVNTALASRSAGSTLKPFIAALALDRGIVSPSERLCDIPRVYKDYKPANFDSKWRGLVSLDDSLVLSLNIPFVHLLEKIRVDTFGNVLRLAGFSLKSRHDKELGLGMAIGNVEVTLAELTGAYALFARAAKGGGESLFSQQSAYLVSQALSSQQRSEIALGHIVDVKRPRFAWKTGTSSAYRDAWTIAWNPEYVIGVWCGHISGKMSDKALVGAKSAAPLVWKAIRLLCPRGEGPWFAQPDGLIRREVCALSGLVANIDCPVREKGVAIRGITTAKLCSMHRRNMNGDVVEVLPVQLDAFLKRADKAKNLVMVKPVNGAVFTLIPGMAQQKIVCKVSGNPDGEKLWWFLNNKLCGETRGEDSFVTDMQKGVHVITCSTEDGVTASVNIEVK